MNKRESWIALAFVLGVVLMLSASPAAASCANECTCVTSCDETCFDGPLEMTCEEWGRCIGSPDCTGPCTCSSTINGTNSGDTLTGGSGHECINGLGGDDTITGNAGFDCADGGAGDDNCYAEYEINCEL